MFERFSDSSRDCVRLAAEEVRELGHDHIGTEHLLIAVAREQHGLGGRILRDSGAGAEELRADARRLAGPGVLDRDALASLGIDLDEVRRRAEQSFGEGALEARAGCTDKPRRIPCSPSSKKAAQLALRFALHVGDDFIGSEHILWAISRVGEGAGACMLTGRGITYGVVETAIRQSRLAA
jgi:ATP-dependent Clp protease ATP-binding subunit ClpA